MWTFLAIILAVPILLVFLVAWIKPKIKPSSNIYLYALSSGLLLMVATVGLLRESFEGAEAFAIKQTNMNHLVPLGLIIGGGSIVGLAVVFVFRYVFVRFFGGEVHNNHQGHDHSDHIINFSDVDNPKKAWLAIILLLSHRSIDGFVLGSLVAKVTAGDKVNWFLIGTFVAHMLIEILIVHYRQVQYGQTIFKSIIYNILTTLILVPIIVIGAFANKFFQQQGWILPLFNASGGAILSFVVIVELVPEFIHLRNQSSKSWHITLILFALGIVSALILLTMHQH